MSDWSSEALPGSARRPGDGWRGPYDIEERERGYRRSGPGTGLLIAGLAAVALGALAWSYLGPDLRRYLKIRNM
jgi:hypothetical protein